MAARPSTAATAATTGTSPARGSHRSADSAGTAALAALVGYSVHAGAVSRKPGWSLIAPLRPRRFGTVKTRQCGTARDAQLLNPAAGPAPALHFERESRPAGRPADRPSAGTAAAPLSRTGPGVPWPGVPEGSRDSRRCRRSRGIGWSGVKTGTDPPSDACTCSVQRPAIRRGRLGAQRRAPVVLPGDENVAAPGSASRERFTTGLEAGGRMMGGLPAPGGHPAGPFRLHPHRPAPPIARCTSQ